jgi:hypothetical protein
VGSFDAENGSVPADLATCAGVLTSARADTARGGTAVKVLQLQSLDGYDRLCADTDAVVFFDLELVSSLSAAVVQHRRAHAVAKALYLGRTRPLDVYTLVPAAQ